MIEYFLQRKAFRTDLQMIKKGINQGRCMNSADIEQQIDLLLVGVEAETDKVSLDMKFSSLN